MVCGVMGVKNMKNKYPTIKPEDNKTFSFVTKADTLYRFRIEAAKRGMSTGKLIGFLIESYINSIDQV